MLCAFSAHSETSNSAQKSVQCNFSDTDIFLTPVENVLQCFELRRQILSQSFVQCKQVLTHRRQNDALHKTHLLGNQITVIIGDVL